MSAVRDYLSAFKWAEYIQTRPASQEAILLSLYLNTCEKASRLAVETIRSMIVSPEPSFPFSADGESVIVPFPKIEIAGSGLAAEWAAKYFSDRPPIQLTIDDLAKGFEQELYQKIVRESCLFLTDGIGMKHVNIPQDYSHEQLVIWNIEKYQVKVPPQSLSCAAYALLLAGDQNVKDYILGTIPVDDQNILKLLEKWNYEPVHQLQKGDLIVYIQDGRAQHVAFWGGEKAVSKFGVGSHSHHVHALESAPFEYGLGYMIFRKKGKVPPDYKDNDT